MMLKDLEAYLKFPGHLSVAKVEFKYLDLPKIVEGFVERKS